MLRYITILGVVLAGWMTEPLLAQPGTLISYERVGFQFVEDIQARANTLPHQEFAQNDQLGLLVDMLVEYPIDVYRVIYESENHGKRVEASGLLLVPHDRPNRWPLLTYLHGTIPPGAEHTAPSLFQFHSAINPLNSSLEVNLVGSIMASHGYVVAMPDYIGYGNTENLDANYTYTPSLARVSRDMLRATRELCWIEDIALTDELYLTGYSEGAGGAMALHRLLEEQEPSEEFTVTASSLLSGFYHYSRMFYEFAASTDERIAAPIYLWSAWVLNQNDPNLQRPQKEIYRHHYRVTPEHFMLKAAWRSTRERTAENLLAPQLRQGLMNGTATDWLTAAQINDHYDWHAKAPVFLHHGSKDTVLPIFHSEDAYQAMTAQGSDVTFYPYTEDNHFSLLENYVAKTLRDFDLIRLQQQPLADSNR